MINSVKLTNFKSHRESTLQFNRGTNLLIGIMGSGKSSILDAFCFAFFGTIPNIDRRKMKLEDLIRLNENFAQIELEFEWENNKYKIVRRINREKKGVSSEAEVYKNNALIESGQSACTEYVERVLEIDYELYTRAIYSEQNNIDHFLNLDPRKRKTEIDTLLGLDKFENARGNLVSLITKINEERKETESKTDRKKFEENVILEEKTREEHAKNEIKKVEITKNIEIKKIEQNREESLLKEILKKIDAIEKMEKEIAELEYFIKANQNEELEKFDIKKIEEIQTKKVQISQIKASIESKLKEMEKGFVKANTELSLEKNRKKTVQENEAKLVKMEQELKEIEKGEGVEKISENNERIRKEILEIGVKIKRNEEKIKENKELLEKLKEGMENCPLCESKIDQKCMEKIREDKNNEENQKTEENKTNINSRKKLEDLLKTEVERMRKIEFLKEKIKNIKNETVKDEKIDTKIDEIEKEKTKLENEIKEEKEKREKIEKEIKEIEMELFTLNKTKTIKEKLDQAVKKVESIKEKLSKEEKPREEAEKSREKISQIKIEIERINGEVKGINEIEKYQKQNLEILQKTIKETKKDIEKIERLGKIESELVIFKNALIETQIELRNSMIDAINMAVKEIWEIIYPYKNYRALKLDATEKDYLFQVDDGRGFRAIESMASGGERASAALALRVAFAMVLTPRLGWMILDEPTHNLDKDAVELLSNTLQFKIPQIVKQTFVITHEELLSGSDFASSYRLIRDKNSNGESECQRI